MSKRVWWTLFHPVEAVEKTIWLESKLTLMIRDLQQLWATKTEVEKEATLYKKLCRIVDQGNAHVVTSFCGYHGIRVEEFLKYYDVSEYGQVFEIPAIAVDLNNHEKVS